MKAAEIFDTCHGRYRGLRDWLADTTGEVRSLDWEKPSSGYSWRPDRGRACEYVADFERIGRRSLRRAEWKGRLKLFELYFIGSMEYRTAIRLVGVAEGTFDYWYREVKRTLGAEFSRTGLFPPARYFHPRLVMDSRSAGVSPAFLTLFLRAIISAQTHSPQSDFLSRIADRTGTSTPRARRPRYEYQSTGCCEGALRRAAA